MEAPPAVKSIVFGSMAGMASKVFEHPFDLAKVRLQAQVLADTSIRFTGPLDCLRKTWLNEGVRGLYRGLPAPIVGAMAENASLFLTYSELQALIRRFSTHYNHVATTSLTLPQFALAGAGSGLVTSFLLTPIELIKCKMQVQMLVAAPVAATVGCATPASLSGPLSVLTTVLRAHGLRGLWLGHTGTLIRETGGTAAWFTTKELVAERLLARRAVATVNDRSHLHPWESALAGACAGAAFNLSLFPADTVKSAMQTADEFRPSSSSALPPAAVSKPTFIGTARAMYNAHGIRAFYAGCGLTVARSIPSSAIVFLIYDGLKNSFG